MERRIRRKVNVTACEVLNNEGEVVDYEYIVRGHITPPRMLLRARRQYGDFATIRNVEQHSITYGMTEEDFIKHAEILTEE